MGFGTMAVHVQLPNPSLTAAFRCAASFMRCTKGNLQAACDLVPRLLRGRIGSHGAAI
jgi:hypothetical protein